MPPSKGKELPPIAEAVAGTYNEEIREIVDRANWLRKEPTYDPRTVNGGAPRNKLEAIMKGLKNLRALVEDMRKSVAGAS
jgi:hypothetical protein